MNHWARFVGLLLIVVVVVIVIAPDVDLPSTVVRSSQLGHRTPLVSFTAVIIHASLALLPQNSIALFVGIVFPLRSDFSGRLIDLNCVRLC